MPFVNFYYYATSFLGSMVDEGEFPQLEAQAERLIDSVIGYAIKSGKIQTNSQMVQDLVKDAICSQIDYIGYYGQEVMLSGEKAGGFTVGKVSVQSGGSAELKAQNNSLCPMAKTLLEQTGLMFRGIPVVNEPFMPFPWG